MRTTFLTITLTLALAFVIPGAAQAQSFNKLYKKYKKQEEVTGVKINKLGCKLVSLFADDDDDEGMQVLRKSSSIHLLVNESAGKSELIVDLKKYIERNSLEQLMSVQDEEDLVEVYILDKENVIHELLIVVSEKDEQVVIHLDGKYPLKMIKKMLSDKDGAKSIKNKL